MGVPMKSLEIIQGYTKVAAGLCKNAKTENRQKLIEMDNTLHM